MNKKLLRGTDQAVSVVRPGRSASPVMHKQRMHPDQAVAGEPEPKGIIDVFHAEEVALIKEPDAGHDDLWDEQAETEQDRYVF